jgi:hypothetical protein
MSEDRKLSASSEDDRTWFEIPLGCHSGDEPTCLPFECEGEAVLVYSESLAYGSFAHPNDQDKAARVAGSRRLTTEDVLKLNDALPFPYLTAMPDRGSTPEPGPAYFGLGDAVSWCLRRVGFSECDDCDSRRTLLNRIPLWPRRKDNLESHFSGLK